MKAIVLRYGVVLAIGIALGASITALILRDRPARSTTVVEGNTARVTVQRDTLRPQDVAPHVKDAGHVKQLVSDQRTQKRTPVVVTESIGTVPASAEPQKVEAITAVSKDDRGQFVAASRLFRLEGAERIALTDVTTTVVRATPERARWRLSGAIQAGVGVVQGSESARGAIAVRWLARGHSPASEDLTWAVLSPVVLFGGETPQVGVAPVSWNAGRLLPLLKDVWIAPVALWDGGTVKAGGMLVASF